MDGYKLYKIYLPLKLHFTSSYDCIKYCGKVPSLRSDTFHKRKDCMFICKVAKQINQSEAGDFCLSNFVYGDNNWLYEDIDNAHSIYVEWQKVNASADRTVETSIKKLSNFLEVGKVQNVESFFVATPSGNLPPLLQMSLIRTIPAEFICAIDTYVFPFLHRWVKYEVDPLVKSHLFTLRKYIPLLKRQFKEPIITKFKELVKSNEQDSRYEDDSNRNKKTKVEEKVS